MFRIDKSIKTEDTSVVDRSWGQGWRGAERKWGTTADGKEISLWG